MKIAKTALYRLAVATALVAVASSTAFAPMSFAKAKPAEEKKEAASDKTTKEQANPLVVLETSQGPIVIEVFRNEAPITANNFLDLVNRKFYDGLTFHRYEPNFVIQGGDPKGDGTGGFIDPKTHQERTIPLEKKKGLRHNSAGIVAMARSTNPDSASCQFYITLAPADFLDNPPGYAVFGKVVDGLPNVMKLRKGDVMKKVSVK